MKKLLSLFLFLISGFVSYAIADVTAPSGRFLQIRTTLQPGSTVYFSSGTVQTYLSANGIMSLPHSATPPPTDCDTDDERGRIYIDTNATSGRQIYACEGTLGWILQGDGSSGGGGGTTILLKDGGSSIVNTSTINFTGATFAISNSGGEGLVAIDFSTIPSRSDVILNQNTLQSGTTFYTSSGTATEFNSSTITISKAIRWPDGTVQVSSPVAGVGSSPGGSNTNIQFNDSSSFAGEPNFSWNKSSDTVIIRSSYTYGSNISAITIISTAVFTSSPSANIAFQFFNTASSTQTVFQIQPTQFSGDTSTSTLVSFNVRGDNILDTVMRIGEPRNSTVPYVEFPTTGTRLNFKGISDDDAYIENNTSSSDLVIAPPPNVGRIRMGSGAKSDVILLLDTGSNDGDMTWDGTNDVLKVSDDIQMQAQNELRFADSDSSNYVGFKSSATVASNAVFTLPSADGTSGQALVTNGNKVLSFATVSGGGGGGSSSLEVFSNFDGTRSSPTASIGIGDTLKLTVSGSTAIINVDPANVILSTSSLQSGATFYVSSGTVSGNISVGSATIAGWSFNGIDNDYVQITPRSSGIRLKIDKTNSEINIGNTASASPVVFTSQNSAGSGNLSYTGPTNGYSSNSHIAMASGKTLRLYDTVDSNYVAFKASATMSQTNTYIVPPTAGTVDQAIVTDGANNLSFKGVVLNQNTLQSGSTFYVSSGTVNGLLFINNNTIDANPLRIEFPNFNGAIGNSARGFIRLAETNTSAVGRAQDIAFAQRSSGGSLDDYGYIAQDATSVTAGSQKGRFRFYLMDSGSIPATPVASISQQTGLIGVQVHTNNGGFFTPANHAILDGGSGTSQGIKLSPSTGFQNIFIGSGESGRNYTLIFDGNTNDGVIEWNNTGDVFISSDTLQMHKQKGIRFTASNGTNYTELKATTTIGSNVSFTLPSADGEAGRAVITNGLGNWSLGLSSAASNTTQNNFPMGDAKGSLQPSSLNYLASYPIFTGSVVYGDNILAIGDMGGLTASLINGALNAKLSFGVGSGFTTTYRVNFPDTPLGAYQAWTSTGPTGNEFQLQNTTVIVSTSGLQTGATFYVSSGTVSNVSVTTITFNDASKLATAPEKEYWWPGAATMPLEATGDNVAAASISTGTNFDVMEASFDSATDECRQVSFFVSTNSLVSVSTVTFGVRWFSLTATSGNTGWYFKHNSGVRSGESWDQTPQAHSSSFDAVGGTARIVTHTEWDVSVSSLTWRGGDVVEGGFCRDADNGSDTMSGDAKAEGFWIRFKRQ